MSKVEIGVGETYVLFYDVPKPRPEGSKGVTGVVTNHKVSRNISLLREFATDAGYAHQENKDHPLWFGEKEGARQGNTRKFYPAWIVKATELFEETVEESDSDSDTEPSSTK